MGGRPTLEEFYDAAMTMANALGPVKAVNSTFFRASYNSPHDTDRYNEAWVPAK